MSNVRQFICIFILLTDSVLVSLLLISHNSFVLLTEGVDCFSKQSELAHISVVLSAVFCLLYSSLYGFYLCFFGRKRHLDST